MTKVITQINAKTEDGFLEAPYPIGSSAQYIKTKFVNPNTEKEETTNLQALIDSGIIGGKIYWTDKR